MDRLTNTIRPYSWGSTTALPELLRAQPSGEPQAELWMGAHSAAPSQVDRGAGPAPLTDVIRSHPEAELSPGVVERFGPHLPFLLKLLAAAQPLSLQVHPNLTQARAGFTAEEDRGVPLDAAGRNYKDANHKPEMLVALGEFDGLCGFRNPHATADLFEHLDVDELRAWASTLRTQPEETALREVLSTVLSDTGDTMTDLVHRTTDALRMVAAGKGPYARQARVYAEIAATYPGDPGVLAALLLNQVRLRAGEALYLGAGVPHAYLNGLGVEVMANSDNVLRCGLTPKHVDVPELLRVVDFRSAEAGVLRPTPDSGTGEELYPAPVEEFRLSRYQLSPHPARSSESPDRPAVTRGVADTRSAQVLLCTAGAVALRQEGAQEMVLRSGESAFVSAGGAPVHLLAQGEFQGSPSGANGQGSAGGTGDEDGVGEVAEVFRVAVPVT